jgi:hypothetical protein|tara:strand:- start:115 stop:240 length:126 start_codon:yes stop_codon:yes gene_type:complete
VNSAELNVLLQETMMKDVKGLIQAYLRKDQSVAERSSIQRT